MHAQKKHFVWHHERGQNSLLQHKALQIVWQIVFVTRDVFLRMHVERASPTSQQNSSTVSQGLLGALGRGDTFRTRGALVDLVVDWKSDMRSDDSQLSTSSQRHRQTFSQWTRRGVPRHLQSRRLKNLSKCWIFIAEFKQSEQKI